MTSVEGELRRRVRADLRGKQCKGKYSPRMEGSGRAGKERLRVREAAAAAAAAYEKKDGRLQMMGGGKATGGRFGGD